MAVNQTDVAISKLSRSGEGPTTEISKSRTPDLLLNAGASMLSSTYKATQALEVGNLQRRKQEALALASSAEDQQKRLDAVYSDAKNSFTLLTSVRGRMELKSLEMEAALSVPAEAAQEERQFQTQLRQSIRSLPADVMRAQARQEMMTPFEVEQGERRRDLQEQAQAARDRKEYSAAENAFARGKTQDQSISEQNAVLDITELRKTANNAADFETSALAIRDEVNAQNGGGSAAFNSTVSALISSGKDFIQNPPYSLSHTQAQTATFAQRVTEMHVRGGDLSVEASRDFLKNTLIPNIANAPDAASLFHESFHFIVSNTSDPVTAAALIKEFSEFLTPQQIEHAYVSAEQAAANTATALKATQANEHAKVAAIHATGRPVPEGRMMTPTQKAFNDFASKNDLTRAPETKLRQLREANPKFSGQIAKVESTRTEDFARGFDEAALSRKLVVEGQLTPIVAPVVDDNGIITNEDAVLSSIAIKLPIYKSVKDALGGSGAVRHLASTKELDLFHHSWSRMSTASKLPFAVKLQKTIQSILGQDTTDDTSYSMVADLTQDQNTYHYLKTREGATNPDRREGFIMHAYSWFDVEGRELQYASQAAISGLLPSGQLEGWLATAGVGAAAYFPGWPRVAVAAAGFGAAMAEGAYFELPAKQADLARARGAYQSNAATPSTQQDVDNAFRAYDNAKQTDPQLFGTTSNAVMEEIRRLDMASPVSSLHIDPQVANARAAYAIGKALHEKTDLADLSAIVAQTHNYYWVPHQPHWQDPSYRDRNFPRTPPAIVAVVASHADAARLTHKLQNTFIEVYTSPSSEPTRMSIYDYVRRYGGAVENYRGSLKRFSVKIPRGDAEFSPEDNRRAGVFTPVPDPADHTKPLLIDLSEAP